MKNILLLILLILNTMVFSQNLVQNPSFELYSNCPTNDGGFDAEIWGRINLHNGTADYFNICSTSLPFFSIPNNTRGTQSPIDGDAYSGLLAYNSLVDVREYIQTQLITPLNENQTYTVSFFVSLAETSGFAINNVGARLTVDPISGDGGQGHVTGFSEIYSTEIISDFNGWVEITGTYIASGGEQFLALGNFFSNDNTSNMFISDISTLSYYYIDQVSVTESTLSTMDLAFEKSVEIFPNPFSNLLNFKFNNSTNIDKIEITSPVNHVITYYDAPSQINLSNLQSGVYFIKITNSDSKVLIKKVIKM